MLRLLRLAKVSEIINLLAERLPNERLVIVIDIVKLITIMLGAAHLIGCVWYAVGKGGPKGQNWLEEFDYMDTPLEYRYIMSLRWALSQFIWTKSCSEKGKILERKLSRSWERSTYSSYVVSSKNTDS